MKKNRLLVFILCLAFVLGSIPLNGNAHERKQHDEIMLTILFRKYDYARTNSAVQDDIDAITAACYLTIDQFNSYGQKDLDLLLNYGVSDIPKNVSEIGYSASGKNHRDFTHRGWDFPYTSEMKTLWPKRQTILRNTVNSVFDFNGNSKKADSFCELLYYIHILGDHEDDTSYTISNGRKIDVGGRHDKEDIIHKLIDLFAVLFADQSSTHKYRGLTTNLRHINSKLSKLVNSQGGINSEEKFQQHKELVQDLIEILSLYVPEMLKEERFFNDVFYRDISKTTITDWFKKVA